MTISCALSGVTGLSGRGMQAYKVVAEDVLSCMESDGFIAMASDGWYRLRD